MGRKYARPPVIEAVCEFRFGADTQWDLAVPGLVYERIRDRLPNREQRLIPRIEIRNTEAGTEQQIHTEQRMFFLTEDKKTFIQVGARLLAVNRLAPYPPWDEFRPVVESAFDVLGSTVALRSIDRIGLLYVNRIEIPRPELELSEYFEFRPFLGEHLPQDVASFVVGCVLPFADERDACRVQLANGVPDQPERSSFILDLDYFLNRSNGVSADAALQWVENAHTTVEQVFEGCITDKLRALFGEVR